MAFRISSYSATISLLLCGLSLARASCGNSNFTMNDAYAGNLASLLSSLPLRASSSLYYSANSTATTSSLLETAYAMFQCRGDLTMSDCSDCVSSAINASAKECPASIASQIVADKCTFMYQNETITAGSFTMVVYSWNANDETDSTFRSNRDTALTTVTRAAPSQGGYNATYVANTISEGVYALAQCSGYLSQSDCAQCLSQASDVQRLIGNHTEGRVNYGTNCYYRFDTSLFYRETPAPVPSPPLQPAPASVPVPSPPLLQPASTNSSTGDKRFLIGTILGSCLLLVFCTLLGFWKLKSTRKVSLSETPRGSRGQNSIELQADLQHQVRLFSLGELEKATRNFDDENKLGEGGFGSVYKGVLENGQFVAIKRLSHPGHHGECQFLSEVKLLTTVQHRNLIKLVGCCIEGPQRLLIYEYILNQSLDKHLFDADQSTPLNWSIRRDIIIGTAKGLAYLHEDSQVRIVHRDIKAANILLDENLHPIIADFGLARLFSVERTHVTTGVAGTLGYLAPEYAMHGQLTEKADIFSYGLVVLEILSGRRNIDTRLQADQHRLLQWIWRLYAERRQLELMDPLLRGNYLAEEAIRMVHVALLCTQAVAGLRPAMSKVVNLLMGRSEIPDIPINPPIVVSSVSELGLQTAQHGIRVAQLYVPPPRNISHSPLSSESFSVYSPLMPRSSQALVTSISDVPEPR